MDTQLINLIFGMKVRQARTEAGLSLSEFAAQCDLSPSYVTEMERGRKYPRTDKIIKMAQVLGKRYDELVSITLDPSLADLEATMASPFLRNFPFNEFGLGIGDLLDLLTRAPDKASALLNAILDVGRQFDLRDEHFLWATLRSYQELHDNYFSEIEDAAQQFLQRYALGQTLPIPGATLETLLASEFGYELDCQLLTANPLLASYRAVSVKGLQPKLLLNATLSPAQRKFNVACELGYRVLGLTERSYTSPTEQATSFAQVLHDAKAAYFAGAVLMPRAAMAVDISAFFGQPQWQPNTLLGLLQKYEATPEMLLYRFSQLIPQIFGIKLNFLRVQQTNRKADGSPGDRYRLIKHLNMNRLMTPSGIALNEHYCRRWLVIQLIRELKALPNSLPMHGRMTVGVQMSEFLESRERFLCFGFATPVSLNPTANQSMTIGFRADRELEQILRFAPDPAIPFVIINETCERCALQADQCTVRAAQPTQLEIKERALQRRTALSQLLAQLRPAA